MRRRRPGHPPGRSATKGWLAPALALACVLATVAARATPRTAPEPEVRCTRFASPWGSDALPGTRKRPYRTVKRLLAGTPRGGTACLAGGVYHENVDIRRGGEAAAPLTLTSAPGTRATLKGVLAIFHSASYVTISNLDLDGVGGAVPSPTVNGDHVTLDGVDVTNEHTTICLVVGGAADTYGVASYTTIRRSRIHDCGKLPPTHYDHGIYLVSSRHARIVDNYVYDNADWGIVLYPDAQDSLIAHNVVDGNGSGIILSGTDDMSANGNVVTHNVVSNSTDSSSVGRSGNNYGFNVTSYWGGSAVGRDNVVVHNCFWNGVSGDVETANGGFSPNDNVHADPQYVDRESKVFELRPGSPCSGDGPRASAFAEIPPHRPSGP